MSWQPAEDAACSGTERADPIETVIVPRARDIGGFEVRRALPAASRRTVGPFVFFDQMGPAEFLTGTGIDVRPHPHIGLATLTYLIEGEILHRDSLGTVQAIRPGAVNLMTAGRGIAHSERTSADQRRDAHRLFGLQAWLALPKSAEETTPAFAHHPEDSIPSIEDAGASARVVVGRFAGAVSPVETAWDTLYVDATLAPGARLPLDAETEDRAVYVLDGAVEIAGDRHEAGRLVVFHPGEPATLAASEGARLLVLGGAVLDGPRYLWWNFVSSDKDRIEAAKADWRAGRFAPVPDETEFIPLPDR
ncbi:MAG: pirin family protein [Azospirillaceae bacterium]